jgi:hypothetical protein
MSLAKSNDSIPRPLFLYHVSGVKRKMSGVRGQRPRAGPCLPLSAGTPQSDKRNPLILSDTRSVLILLRVTRWPSLLLSGRWSGGLLLQLPKHRPHEARQFTHHGHDRHRRRLAPFDQMPIASVQSLARPVRPVRRLGRLILTPKLQGLAHGIRMTVMPGRLRQDPTHSPIARLGDRSRPAALTTGVLRGSDS